MIQLPTQPITPDSLRRAIDFDWNRLLGWDVVVRNLSRIAVILVVAFIGYRLIKLLLARIVTHEVDAEDPIVKRLRQQRAQTLGGLLENVALVVIVTFTGLTILGTFMPIGPLLAGVSVVGLAVSFGAQSLVKDIITGTFILFEGQFGIGDVIRIGDTAGAVEKLTLRTTTLRDFEGVVHIIPNGEIKLVSNLTKSWSRTVVDIMVDYREDVDRAIDVLKRLGTEFENDPDWGPLLLEEPEVLGIQKLDTIGLQIRMQTKTLPLKQWEVGRELRRRIKKAFDAEGIGVPLLAHVTFYWGEDAHKQDAQPTKKI
ncbi:MAG: mechanosensitive ion channel family protein [Gemmatimonadota bacterium]